MGVSLVFLISNSQYDLGYDIFMMVIMNYHMECRQLESIYVVI